MGKGDVPKPELSLGHQPESAVVAPAERNQPDYIKLVGEFFAQNPTVLAEAQNLLHKLFRKKDAGGNGWGDINPETFRKQFTALMPEEIRKAYRKEIRGMDGVSFANFIKELVSQAQSYIAKVQVGPAEVQSEAPQPYSQAEYSALVQEKIAAEIERKPQVLDEILPEFNENRVVFARGDRIFEIARKNDIAVSQAVRFLYEYFSFGDKFNELRKAVQPTKDLSKEQALLCELVNLLEPERQEIEKEKETASNFFISMPYKPKKNEDRKYAEHRSLFFVADVSGKTGTQPKIVRFSVQLPFGVDIGKGQELYAIALDIARQYNPALMKDSMTFFLSSPEFEQAWRKNQSPEEKQRIQQRADFIKEAKSVFESDPEEFILNNKLAEFAAGIPNEEAIRYLADEEFIGEYRQKYHKDFEELKSKSDAELAKFAGLNKDEVRSLTREQLLLKVVAELLKRAKIEAIRSKQGRESDEARATEMTGNGAEAAEDLESHPVVVAARAAMFKDFEEQMAGTDFPPEELGQVFEKYWREDLYKQLLEELKQEHLV